MAGTILASVPVNTEGGSYLTFAFPVALFCVIAAILYVLLFSRPHARVPARRVTAPAHVGGGPAESGAEPAGAVPAADAGTGNVQEVADGDGAGPADGTGPGEGTGSTDNTEASE